MKTNVAGLAVNSFALGAIWALAILMPQVAAAICEVTEADQLGPYYEQGAPYSGDIAGPEEEGERLVISGRVLGAPDCRPLPDAVVDVWQASASGKYYSLGKDGERFRLRGRVRTDPEGRYRIDTILPGRYAIGPGYYRPPHVHFAVSHADYTTVVTQIYFKGEGFRDWPPFAEPTRVVELRKVTDEQGQPMYTGTFDIILPPGKGTVP